MTELCQLAVNYTNLLKPVSVIGTEFIRELRAQQQELGLVRRFGISKTLSLISIRGAISRIILEGAKGT